LAARLRYEGCEQQDQSETSGWPVDAVLGIHSTESPLVLDRGGALEAETSSPPPVTDIHYRYLSSLHVHTFHCDITGNASHCYRRPGWLGALGRVLATCGDEVLSKPLCSFLLRTFASKIAFPSKKQPAGLGRLSDWACCSGCCFEPPTPLAQSNTYTIFYNILRIVVIILTIC
jgi:hypothetical protein